MKNNSLELFFYGFADVQLVETRFQSSRDDSTKVNVRGKTAGPIRDAGTFQWTSAVKALSILCIKAVLAKSDESGRAVGHLLGFKGSLAASLDFALSKQPLWLTEICGVDLNGNAYARRIILRTNPERKRPGPVILGLNERVLATNDIKIFWNDQHVTDPAALRQLVRSISVEENIYSPQEQLSSMLDKLAA